ncbi:hypothetical protein DN752_17745 [Echinicola strongylocentroti]|uniref:Bacterial repeat domain-containing protein n=1 Tax=Echinicola strongylocentroti TaxID=1795355 RepID=A0A2Z4ILL2_9BACT|nr:hypothetical protein [Echinicola strongylocentroti]AWW31825.1 hypothetical protein DN752_17745 [Echinicola strongylocentroti]
MAGICHQWTIPQGEVSQYLVNYTPVDGALTNVSMTELEAYDNGDGTNTIYLCSETAPTFEDANNPGQTVSFPYTVTSGGSCTDHTMCNPNSPPLELSLTVIASPSEGGSAVDETGEYIHEENDIVPLLATANEGYQFVNWTIDEIEVSDQASFDFVMPDSDTFITANFEEEAPPPDPDPDPKPTEPGVPVAYLPLELRVAGKSIPIDQLTRKRITGIFTSDLVGDYSYPITIPLDQALMTALGLPNDPQTAWDFSVPFDAELWKSGNRIYKGKLEILEANDDTIEAVFALNSGFFVSAFAETKLGDCYEDEDIITLNEPEETFKIFSMFLSGFSTAERVDTTVNGTTKQWNRADYDISGEVQAGQEDQYYNHVQEQLSIFYQDVLDWLHSLGIPMETSVVYSNDEIGRGSYIKVIEQSTALTISVSGFTTRRGEWIEFNNRNLRVGEDDDIRLDMSNFDNFDPSKRIAFPQLYNRELYEGNNAVFDGQVNRYDPNGYLHITNSVFSTWEDATNWEHTAIPFLYLTEVVKKVFAKAGIVASGEFFEEDMVKHMLLYNNRTLDFVEVKSTSTGNRVSRITGNLYNPDIDNPNYSYRNVLDLAIKVKNHLPDVSCPEFLKGLKNFFGLKYDFNPLQNRVDIRFIRNIIRSRDVLDLTKQAHRVYTLKHAQENGFSFSYDNPDPLFADGLNNQPPEAPDYTVQKYTDMTALNPELEEIALVQSLGAYFRFEKAKDESPAWELYAFVMQDEEASEFKIDKPLTLYSLKDAWVDGKKLPAIEMTANNPEAGIENKEIGLRIFGFYGQQTAANGDPYSFASANHYKADETVNANQYDLNIRSEHMGFWWKDLETIQGKPRIYESVLLLSDADMINLSKTSLIRIRNIVYLIDEIEEAITRDEQTLAKVKMYKVKTK